MSVYPDAEMEMQEMISKVAAYLETEEGQAKLKQLRDTIEEFEKKLRKQEEVDPLKLLEPMTI